jgi:multiple sugar transport system substrate-binding protein
MTHVSRRQFLAASAAVGVAGIEGIVAARRAPAYAQGTRLHLLQWSHFVPAADTLFETQAKEFGKQAGVEVAIERINQNDLQTRATAAIQSGAGPDIIILANNHAHLYEASLVDVSDVAEEIGRKQGGWYEYAKVNTFAGGRWIGVPQFIISWAITYREDWLKEAGFEYPKTWDDFRKVGRAMKAKGKPFGQAFGHSINDPNNWCYPLVWMWGGAEVAADGRSVVLNSKNTIEAVKFNTVLWKEVFDEGGLAWDDSSNNRAYLAGTISATVNGASIYFVAKRQFPDIAKVTNHGDMPKGPGGRFYAIGGQGRAVMKYSKNQQVAKEFLRWFMDRPQYDKWMAANDGYTVGPTPYWEKHPLWERDPKLIPFREASKFGRWPGYPGPPSRKASEALVKYILVDMYAQAIKGMKPEDAVKWAEVEMKKAYGA